MKTIRQYALAGMIALCGTATAQTQTSQYVPGITTDGVVYLLPKTELRFVVQIEKTTKTPGDFRNYAKRYLRVDDVIMEPSVSHKINSIRMTTAGAPDQSKAYVVKYHAKSSATNVQLSDDGILLAINDKVAPTVAQPLFQAAPKPERVNPRQYLRQEILAAGSTAKMAELTAKEIYDIRESTNELTRGEADYMPKDGAQLRLMLAKLAEQDAALTGMFCGTTERDTVEMAITLCPDGAVNRQVLFRLSQQMGVVDADDLAGEPFYITVEDLHSLPPVQTDPKNAKKQSGANGMFSKKNYETGVIVNVPGKALVTVSQGAKTLFSQEINAAQFGHAELLGAELFSTKYITRLTLNPTTGAVNTFESVATKK